MQIFTDQQIQDQITQIKNAHERAVFDRVLGKSTDISIMLQGVVSDDALRIALHEIAQTGYEVKRHGNKITFHSRVTQTK